MANLLFDRPPLVGSPTNLVFGESDTPVLVRVDVAIQAQLPNTLLVTLRAGQPVRATVVASLANTLAVSAGVVYDNRVTPWKDQRSAMPHQRALNSRALLRSDWGVSASSRRTSELLWHPGARHAASLSSGLQIAVATTQQVSSAWSLGRFSAAARKSSFEKAIARSATAAAAWQLAAAQGGQVGISLQTGVANQADAQARWNTAITAAIVFKSQSGASLTLVGRQFASSPWQVAMRAAPGRSLNPPIVLPPVPGVWSTDLLFECPPLVAPIELIFGKHPCGGLPLGASFYILPGRVFMTTHNLIARLLPDMTPVPLYNCTLAADVGSFAWQFSANGPESLFAQLAPTIGPASALPQLLQITLDGLQWVFLVESLRRQHTFGKRSVSISGRSQTALLGAPWARDNAYMNAVAADAQQLAAQALDSSGVALDWGITDWLVPANAWSYSGSSLAAVQAIAEAAGGYLQSHRSLASLQVRHPYPPRPSGDGGGPWNWNLGPADVQLAPDAVITSGIERKDGADIDAVYVSGTTQGVLAWVKREGTAGAKLASPQTDPLITAAAAARQRGLSVLGRSGAQFAVSLELPILTGAGQPGVIDVGNLIQVNDAIPWRGRVRSVQVTADMPKARQTITLERHL